jgi:hypothetical protein
MLYRLKLNELVTAIPTVGFNVETIEHNRKCYTLWDVGGTWPKFLEVSHTN